VLTNDNPRTEDPERILDDVAEGLQGVSYERLVDRRDAIRRALELAEPGDTVVLTGKGHETYQAIGGKKVPFDERVIVRELLSEMGIS
jgi:UDP-N-acetylmuramoyl-L-alanyl-D-glutamate--2,6-diaminopimelate ligase